jgi:hypothetical protein
MPSPLRFLRAGPPPPNVVLLPDALFFTRVVAVSEGATTAAAAAEIELALEAVSPFPLAQLYYGWFWKPGSRHALLFAAYRRRFTAEQTAAWAEAELVLPTFAALAGAEVPGATTIVLTAPEGLTAVHWEAPGVPSQVKFLPLAPEANEEERARLREDLLRAIGGSKKTIDLAAAPAADSAKSDREVIFRAGEVVSRLPAPSGSTLDVRDKAELAALRAARGRDVLLWRLTVGAAAALVLLGLGELGLVGGRFWQQSRTAIVRAQQPTVLKIMSSQSLANRIDELATKRLLPFEMITQMIAPEDRKPKEIQFVRVRAKTSDGINKIEVDCTSSNDALLPVYKNTLSALPTVQSVEDLNFQTRNGTATFTLVVTFKPETLKPADSITQ